MKWYVALIVVVVISLLVERLGWRVKWVGGRRKLDMLARLAASGPATTTAAPIKRHPAATCHCEQCLIAEHGASATSIAICPVCGDRRCAHAAHHDLPCSMQR